MLEEISHRGLHALPIVLFLCFNLADHNVVSQLDVSARMLAVPMPFPAMKFVFKSQKWKSN